MSIRRPGGQLASRPLHFIFILDCSGSMASQGKIQALNVGIREAIPAIREVAQHNPAAQVLVRAVTFADGAQWHIPSPVEVSQLRWSDVSSGGETAMGQALRLVADELRIPPMERHALPPVLILISDGMATDDFSAGLKALMETPWGPKAVRLAISIGEDADVHALQKFIGNPELKPLAVKNADQLVKYVRETSTMAVEFASVPNRQPEHRWQQLGASAGVVDAAPAGDDIW